MKQFNTSFEEESSLQLSLFKALSFLNKKNSLVLLCLLITGSLFAQAPTITSFSPNSGPVGTLVTITGTNLSTPTTFTIGGVNAIVVSNTGTQLVGLVMPGAVTGSISISTASGTATSSSFTLTLVEVPTTQEGDKLIGTGASTYANQGYSSALSADGNTAIIGAPTANNDQGAVWIFTRSGGIWTQQGNKLVGTGGANDAYQGRSVSISDDGNTVIIGGWQSNNNQGAAWIFTCSGGIWTQQGNKLVGTGVVNNNGFQEIHVSISGDGNTAILGAPNDNNGVGGAWVFVRNGGVWTQQGNKLVGTGAVGQSYQSTVSLSSDGNTAILGGEVDNNGQGAVWVFTRSGGIWTQQGNKLVGTGAIGAAYQGSSVSISGDGNTIIVGGRHDNYIAYQGFIGACWIFTRSGGVWIQQGNKLVGTGYANINHVCQGYSSSISADGNKVIVGGNLDNNYQGAAWIFVRNGGIWTQQGNKLVGTGGASTEQQQGFSVCISDDGNTAFSGGPSEGANWAFIRNGSVWTQQGNKLVGIGAQSYASQGCSIAVSADGNTAIVGGYTDGYGHANGAVWIFTRNGSMWTQQGPKLVGTGGSTYARQGKAVALNADGNTAIIGGYNDNSQQGAAWIFTRSGSTWTQQGNKLVGTGVIGYAQQGFSVALSADGNTAIIGGNMDDNGAGATWVFTRNGGVWTQQGSKLVGTLSLGTVPNQGAAVAISADGNTILIGGPEDYSQTGAAWIFTRNGNTWTQQGNKIRGTGFLGDSYQGAALSLSADGNTAILGGYGDNGGIGASWIFIRNNGVWTQQGSKLIGNGAVGSAVQGKSVSLSSDGKMAIVGGYGDNNNEGAVWVFKRNGNTWTQQGSKLVGTGGLGSSEQGNSVALSADGNRLLVGGPNDYSTQGAVWVYKSLACLDAGTDKTTCGTNPITMTPAGTGTWTGGLGTWNGNNYTPDISEVGTNLSLIWTVTAIGNCTNATDTAHLFVAPFPTQATISPTGPTAFCANVSPTILQSNTGLGFTYQWFNGNTPVGTNSSTFTPSLSGNYTLMVTDANGCISTSSATPITIYPILDTVQDASVVNCGVNPNHLQISIVNAIAGSNAPFSVHYSDGTNSYTENNYTNNTDIPVPYIGNNNYTLLQVTDANACNLPGNFGIIPNVSVATISLTSSTPTICSGGAANITFNAGAGASNYTWQQSTNGGASWYSVSGTNTTTTSIVATLSVTRLFKVIYTNICGLDTTPVFTLNVVPDPTVTLTASNNNFCAGTSTTTVSATLNGGIGTGIYQWQQYIGSVWTDIVGATNASYTTPTLSASTNYKVISSQTGLGCVTTGANTINITVKPLPGIYIYPASPAICTGGSVTINAYNATSYSWSPPTGLSATTGTPIIASPTATTTYSLTGIGSNGCSKTISVPVTVNPTASISITGDTTICSGGSVTLNSTTSGGAGTCTRQWQSSANGTTWSNIAGATGTSYTTPALTSTTYYRVTYNCNGGGCSQAATSPSHKIHLFNNVLSIVGNTNLCVGGSVKLLAPTMGGTYQCNWTWESSPNGTIWTIIPNATLTYYYPPTNTASNTYYRANTNCVGAACTNIPTAGMLITVNPDPSITITGQNSICGSGSTVLAANPSGGAGTSTYQWQENISGVFTNIAGATNLTYTTPVLTAAKTYRVSHSATGSGCGLINSTNFLISILTLPNITTNPASPSFCIGGTSTITAYNGTSYSWSPATGLSATTGSPVTASPTATLTYSLTGVGTNGCSKTISVPVTVTADPNISISGPSTVPTGTSATLTSTTSGGSGTCTRQWQSSTNGSTWTNVAGATGTTYTTPAIIGTKYYRATYTCNASGCSPAATSNVLAITGIQAPVRLEQKVYDLSLYPNPASVNLIVLLSASEDLPASFLISDMLGKTLIQWEGMPENGVYEQEVSIETLSQGVYFLSVRIGDRVMTEKFVKE